MDLVQQSKDAITLGALVWTTVQIIKGLIRWRVADDVPNPLIQAIAAMVSVLVALCAIPRAGQYWDDWLLQVGIYAMVIILPIALAGHTVAGLGDPLPPVTHTVVVPGPAPVTPAITPQKEVPHETTQSHPG